MCNREMATFELGFTRTTVAKKSSRLRCICCVVRANIETTDGSNPTSRLLLEHIDSVFIFHFQLLREWQLFQGEVLPVPALPACEVKAAVIRIGCLKWQVSVSKILCDILWPKGVYTGQVKTTDRQVCVAQWKCSYVMCSGDWEQNLSALSDMAAWGVRRNPLRHFSCATAATDLLLN